MGFKTLKYIGLYSLLGFLILNSVLSFISINVSFIIFGLSYVLIVYGVGQFIEKKNRLAFTSIVYLFFFVYSLFSSISYFLIYENPLIDHLGDTDQIGYYEVALSLSSYSFKNIWQITFTEFRYNGSPLFYGWVSSLHKLSGLDIYYGALFQKLNVVFFGSLIPAIIYLMLEKIVSIKKAIKWSVIYGLMSFNLYYSVILLRDIHLVFLYTLAFYIIINEKFSIKDYILLIIIGICSYFIRVENGLFFLGFYAIWIMHSKVRNKWVLFLLSIPVIAGIIIYVGGFETIFNRVFGTISFYSEDAVKKASEDSLGAALNKLPIPLNWVAKTGFSQITPFPFWTVYEDKFFINLFSTTRVIGALFWTYIWVHIILNISKLKPIIIKYKWPLLLALAYIIFVSQGNNYERRIFQVYPLIYMFFVIASNYRRKASQLYFVVGYLSLIFIYIMIKFNII